MQHKRVLLVAGLALAWSSTAFAGLPSWCKGYDSGAGESGAFKYPSDDGDDRTTLQSVVNGSCSTKAGAAFKAEVDKARADMSKRLFMNDADWTDAVSYVTQNGSQHTESDIELSANAFGRLTPVDQYKVISDPPRMDHGGFTQEYLADALEQNLTETGRLGYLEKCASSGAAQTEIDPVVWGMCQGDVAKFAPNKLAAELRADTTHPAWVRTMLHIRLGAVVANLRKEAAAAAKLVKSDDAYGKLFAAAAKGRADWDKTLASQTELLALLQQLDSAVYFHSKKQFAGCEDKVFKAVAGAAAKIPASSFKGMHDSPRDPFGGFAKEAEPVLAGDPQMNLAGNAFALCLPTSGLGALFGDALGRIPGYRGPRSAAFQAMFSQKFELDDTNANGIKMPDIGKRPYDGNPAVAGNDSYVVASLKPAGEGKVALTSPKSSVTTDDCVSWHETNKIIDFDTAGRPVYQRFCVKSAMVKHDTTPMDITITAATAKWIKPGMLCTVTGASNGKPGDVLAAWRNKTAKLPSLLLGAAIK